MLIRKRGRRRRAEQNAGQAMVEFSLVIVLFLMVVITAIEASFWAVESMASTSATEDAVRIASTAGGPQNGYSLLPAVASANQSTLPELKAALLGTPIVVLPACIQTGGVMCVDAQGIPLSQACPNGPDQVWAQYQKPTIVECEYFIPTLNADCPDPFPSNPPAIPCGGLVTIRVEGYGNAYFGDLGGFGFLKGIPIDVQATTHTLTFEG